MRGDKEHNVTTIDPSRGMVSCNECGYAWWYNLRTGGCRPTRWWLCPQGCNDPRQVAGAEDGAAG
jgi:hypothetical protein